MPRGDGTGPMGAGRMRGRRAGYCAGFETPGYISAGRGWRRGLQRGFSPVSRPEPQHPDTQSGTQADTQTEIGALKQLAQGLRFKLEELTRRIESL
ncbi:MAG: DUF5320 domain-containing protein [Deltaproteobacteria bacterium]|nr:DUF5320 domain-containing protein [Deltaproteobacteria bacterium]